MRPYPSRNRPFARHGTAFTLVEMVMAVVIIAAVFATVLLTYSQTARRAQWSGYQLAAQALAIQQIEQVRSARWDLYDLTDETLDIGLIDSNRTADVNWELTGYTWANLDIPYSGSNFVRATNFVTISVEYLGSSTNIAVRMVRVDTVWPFAWGKKTRLFTNTICTYCAPDN